MLPATSVHPASSQEALRIPGAWGPQGCGAVSSQLPGCWVLSAIRVRGTLHISSQTAALAASREVRGGWMWFAIRDSRVSTYHIRGFNLLH